MMYDCLDCHDGEDIKTNQRCRSCHGVGKRCPKCNELIEVKINMRKSD